VLNAWHFTIFLILPSLFNVRITILDQMISEMKVRFSFSYVAHCTLAHAMFMYLTVSFMSSKKNCHLFNVHITILDQMISEMKVRFSFSYVAHCILAHAIFMYLTVSFMSSKKTVICVFN
jgi:hypothetical protein